MGKKANEKRSAGKLQPGASERADGAATGTTDTPAAGEPVEPLERARLLAEVARQRVRIAKEELKRARKRVKEAKREAKRARRQAAATRKAWKKARKAHRANPAPQAAAGKGRSSRPARSARHKSTRAHRTARRARQGRADGNVPVTQPSET